MPPPPETPADRPPLPGPAITADNLMPALQAAAQARGAPRGFRAWQGPPEAWGRAVRPWLRELILPDFPADPGPARVIWRDEAPLAGGLGRVALLDLVLPEGLVLPALFACPPGPGPHPAILALHDHGSEFRIGKEKCLSPPGAAPPLAQAWWARFFGGRPWGEAAVARGFAVFCADAPGWGGRIGNGYEGQQALAANLLALGYSPAGLLAWEDLRQFEALRALPGIDPARIAAMGFSMGGFRAWQLAALEPRLAALVAISWMASLPKLLVAGNNQTRGQSAFWMTHPLLARGLDLPDMAALAAPRPAWFDQGLADPLFPQAATDPAWALLREVWDSLGATASLELQSHPGGHDFRPARQDAALDWLAGQM